LFVCTYIRSMLDCSSCCIANVVDIREIKKVDQKTDKSVTTV